ncbi:hybrid sensor histidine kinase/response regulator [Shewanella woodyi]|uniref:hybrid sensor histidine kinase/response regulator n=1 Tax=Shewanella woodyi TaxID=60961 RepID=UPI0007EA5898|nr:hybrid sensor histidine kinase/response regulator [Shewanella woodyi]
MKFKPYSICYLIVGLTVTFCIDWLFWSHSQREFAEFHDEKSAASAMSAHDMLMQHKIITRSIHSFFSASMLVTKKEFTEFTHELLKIKSAIAFTIGEDNKLAFISNPEFEDEIKQGRFTVNGKDELTFELAGYSSFLMPIDQAKQRYMVYIISHGQVLERLNSEEDICIAFMVTGKLLSNHYCQMQLSDIQRTLFYYQSEEQYHGSEFGGEDFTLTTWYSAPIDEINEILLIIFLFSVTGVGFSILLYLKVEQRNMLYKMRIETDSKVAVLSAINHEIRTPINAVLGYSHMLKNADCCAPQGDMTINKIIWSANLLHSVAENTLNFSKASADKLMLENQATDLAQFINNIKEYYIAFSETGDKKLNLFIDKPLPPSIAIDSTKLYQLITNIINNAFKYSTGKQVNCHIALKRYQNSPFLRVAIRDFGKGMSKASMEALSRPFTAGFPNSAAQQSGIGIGLYTCKQVIEKVGGKIAIRSRKGQGTLVIIRFPFEYMRSDIKASMLDGVIGGKASKADQVPALANLTSSSMVERAQEVERSSALYQLKPILLVDDNLFNLEVCRSMLEKQGFSVTTCRDAASTIEHIKNTTPEIVLMDYRLEETNGLALIDELMELQTDGATQERIKTTHYFILSANEKSEIPFSEEYPDVFFMQKPLNIDVFIQQLDKIYA